MKRKMFFVALSVLLAISAIGLIMYSQINVSPKVSVELNHGFDYANVYSFEWKVINLEDKKSLVFENGNIINYSIKNINTNEIYSNLESDREGTIVLKPKEVYTKKISLKLEDGEYELSFEAISKKGAVNKVKGITRIGNNESTISQ